MRPPLLLVGLLLAAGLAGCAGPADVPASEAAPAKPARMDWSPGTWWAYHARIQGVPVDVTLVVSEVHEDGYVLGTNLTSGFFGLPWSGNVTRERNPIVAGEVWPLFAPPHHDGKSWTYRMRGHDATALARAAPVETPEGEREGFVFDARSWGRTFARYDLVEEVGWFASLELVEPTNGQVLLDARLVAYGDEYLADYYVERTLREVTIRHPALPGEVPVEVPGGALEVHATLSASVEAGALRATLEDARGRALAQVEVLGRGADADTAATREREDLRWTVRHAGAGAGSLTLRVTGVFPAR